MKQTITQALLVILLAITSGCATVFTNDTQQITFKSIPPGANVEMNGQVIGRTPLTAPVKRGFNTPQVRLKMDGYKPEYVIMQTSMSGLAILDILIFPAFIIDAATDHIMNYDIVEYEAELTPKQDLQ